MAADERVETADREAIARRAFEELAARFPTLSRVEDQETPVTISVTIPVQEGVRQSVWLGLDGDELHFCVGRFSVQWFPCTDEEVVRQYVEAVSGYLSGSSRVLEHLQGGRCVKAELQVPADDGWRTIGVWSRLHLPMPWKRTVREVRNA